MAERIFVMDEDGNLESMDEITLCSREHLTGVRLQNILNFLTGEQMRPDNPRLYLSHGRRGLRTSPTLAIAGPLTIF